MQVKIDGYAWLPVSDMEPAQLAWLKNQLTVARVGRDCSLVNCFVLDEERQFVGIAREFFYGKITKSHDISIDVTRAYVPSFGAASNVSLSEDQSNALQLTLEALRARVAAGAIVTAPAGWGKVDVVSEVIREMSARTLILVNSPSRAALWSSKLDAAFPGAKTGGLRNRKWEIEDCPVVVCMTDRVSAEISRRTTPQGIEKAFGLVVVDQIHQVDADSASKVIGFFHAAKRIGMSAKVSRGDKADKVFEYHIGKRSYTSRGHRLLPKVRRVWTTFRIKHPYFNAQLATRDLVVDLLTKNVNYNQDVVGQIMQALDASRKIVVFSDSFEHLKRMRQETEARYRQRIIKTDYIIDGMLDSDIESASLADVIFASYKMAERNLDIPSIDTVVLASPVKNPERPSSWSLLPFPGKKDPIIVDVRADQIPLCKEYADSRDRAYERFFPAKKASPNA